MSKIPEHSTQAKRRTSERLRIKREKKENGPDQRRAEGSDEGFIQDQIIIAPEIMRKVLEQLDVRTLKRVRLVCKSWLLEAQFHMERRGTVWLSGGSGSCTRIQEFMKTRKNKIPALPQPLSSVDTEMICGRGSSSAAARDLSQLLNLRPLVALRRFNYYGLPLTLALPLIIQSSSDLEYLHLWANDSAKGYRIPGRNKDVTFSKLRCVDIDAHRFNIDYPFNEDPFSRLVAWIMKVSPNIDSFKIRGDLPHRLANQVLLQVDLRNVATLTLKDFELEQETANHLASTSFSKLQNLSICEVTGEAFPQALLAIVRSAAATLRKFELGNAYVIYEVTSELPVCPNVQTLSLGSFPHYNELVTRCFPSLQHLETSSEIVGGDEMELNASSPLVGVKSLELSHMKYRSGGFEPTTLFTTFPALESLHIHESFLFKYSRVNSSGDCKSLDMLQGLKHLELERSGRGWYDDADYSWLLELKGIETLTLSSFPLSQVMQIPAAEMQSLKVLRLSWEEEPMDVNQLLQFVKAVKRVEITNCCSVRREMNVRRKDLLEKFFDSAPNAICGCK